jgi:integrase
MWLEKRGRLWWIADRQGNTVRRIKAYSDKGASEAKLAKLKLRLAQGAEGLADPYEQHRKRPILEHVADWFAELKLLGRSASYIEPAQYRMARLIRQCGWKRLDDITGDSFSAWRSRPLVDHRQIHGVVGARTMNHHLQTLRSFCCWCVKRGRMAADPVRTVEKVAQAGDVRRQRRALAEAEIAVLLAVMPADHRLVYQFIMATGLRRKEVAALVWSDLHLGAVPSDFLTLRASTTKSKRADSLPIRHDIAQLLQDARGDAEDSAKVFPFIPSMKWHKRYLRLAGIPYLDDQGRQFDFHALRVQFITGLNRAGVPIRSAMALARHTDAKLTLKNYTDMGVFNLAGAVESLPSTITPSSPTAGIATGTDPGVLSDSCDFAGSTTGSAHLPGESKAVIGTRNDEDGQSASDPCISSGLTQVGTGRQRYTENGGGGIRTHGTLLELTGFQDRPVQPLRHSSDILP